MKKISLFVLIFLLSSSLYGYSKKIIFSAFSNMQNAQRSLQGFKETNSYQKLDALAKANDFTIHARVSGRYYIVVAEPFFSESTAQEAFRIGKKEYRNAYMNTYEPPEEPKKKLVKEPLIKKVPEIKKPDKPVKIDKEESVVVQEIKKSIKIQKPQEIKNIEKNETKVVVKELKTVETEKTEIEKIVEEHNKTNNSLEKTKEFAFNILDILLYLFLAIILGVIIFYFIKFKRVYDEY